MGYDIDGGEYVQAADLEQVYRSSGPYAADAEASDAYEITVVPAPDTIEDGMVFRFKPNTANAGAATLDVNGKGAKAIKKNYDQDLETGDLPAGIFVEVEYDGDNDWYQLLSLPARMVSANLVPNTDKKSNDWFTSIIPIDSLRWTHSSTVTYFGFGAELDASGAWTSTLARLIFRSSGSAAAWDNAPLFRLSFLFSPSAVPQGTTPFAGTDRASFVGVSDHTANATSDPDITVADERVGFAYYDGKIYALSSSTSNVQTTDLGAYSSRQLDQLMIEVDRANSVVRFYRNGVLVATHNTHLPFASSNTVQFVVAGVNSAGGGAGGNISHLTVSQMRS